MHQGPIPLPDPIKARCIALANLGNLMQLYSINSFIKVMEVSNRLQRDRITIFDLQEIKKLCTIISESELINDNLRTDINELFAIIDLFLQAATVPARPCGIWLNASVSN